MAIRVIETSTAERNQQTKDLFEKVKILLEEGWPFNKAVLHVTGRQSIGTQTRGWYRDLKEYSISQGYDPKDYEWKRVKDDL